MTAFNVHLDHVIANADSNLAGKTYLKKRMETFIRFFVLSSPASLAFSTKEIALGTNMPRDLTLHRIIRWASIRVDVETSCVFCFSVPDLYWLRVCLPVMINPGKSDSRITSRATHSMTDLKAVACSGMLALGDVEMK